MRVSDVARQIGMSPSYVRKMVYTGQLECGFNLAGQRVFTQEQVDRFLGTERVDDRFVFYVRSSKGDTTALDAQEQELREAFGEPLRVFKDRGSGLSEDRKGLNSLLLNAGKGKFSTVYVTFEDRLSRFGFSYLERLLAKDNVRVVVLHDKVKYSVEEELLQDFMSLLASFSGRFYRLRSKQSQRRLLAEVVDKLGVGEDG